jgi:phosphoribosyl 1,2-cyclic phosphodiesterase
MIEVCSLASGSNGNAFLIRTGVDSFLVDAGISCKQICMRLQQVGSDIGQINGIFVTHEHSDHVKGLDVLLRKHPTPVYITEKTFRSLPKSIDPNIANFIRADDSFMIGETEIRSMSKSHDAIDPTLFCFYYRGKKISVITDAGYACGNVLDAVRDADILFLESNYDDQMLQNGIYPPFLKARVAGRRGHLSNVNAGQLIRDHASDNLQYVFLSHLSENNNTPELAMHTFHAALEERTDLSHLSSKTILTSRQGVSSVVKIEPGS